MATDIPLLADKGFTPGYSGESWFAIGRDGNRWQAYVVEDDKHLTFVNDDDRVSKRMPRDKFEELFSWTQERELDG